jgi:hypothetical protein
VLVNEPPPVPLVVLVVRAVVGFGEVLQHTPRTVTVDEQSPDMVPPEVAPVEDIPLIAAVVMEGVTAAVVNITSAP